MKHEVSKLINKIQDVYASDRCHTREAEHMQCMQRYMQLNIGTNIGSCSHGWDEHA